MMEAFTISPALAIACLCVSAAALALVCTLVGLLLGILLLVRPHSPAFRDHSVVLSRQPYWAFFLGTKVLRWVWLFAQLKPAPLRAAEVATAYIHSQVLFVLVNLGVAEALKDGPKTAQQLAAAAGPDTNPEWLARVLKLAAELGLVKRKRVPGLKPNTPPPPAAAAAAHSSADDGSAVSSGSDQQHRQALLSDAPPQPFSTGYSCNDVYSANAVTAVLCRDHPNCMVDFVQLMEDHYGPCGFLSKGVQSSQVPFQLWSGGLDVWQHIKASPRHAATFDGAMRAANHMGAKIAVLQYPWDKYDVVVDIAGGNGQLLAELLSRYPKLQGVLVDQQGQVERGKKWWSQEFSHLLPRMQFVVGDMFQPETLPRPRPGLKMVYVLKHVLHDWSDADSLAILKAVRTIISDQDVAVKRASLAVLETGAFERLNPQLLQHRLVVDINMLEVVGDGKERDEAQARALLQAAGFTPGRLLPTTGITTIFEATPTAGR